MTPKKGTIMEFLVFMNESFEPEVIEAMLQDLMVGAVLVTRILDLYYSR